MNTQKLNLSSVLLALYDRGK